MNAEIIDKKSGSRRSIDEGEKISLHRPSVIVLKLAPENVASYERRGDDLVLILKDGQEIAIDDFFVKYPDANDSREGTSDGADGTEGIDADEGRNELVLQDDYGVVWWGQYPEEWSEFHFTEIELDDVAGFVWWPWLLGILGGGAGIAALASGGGEDPKHPPVATDDIVTTAEDTPVSGNVLTNDSDPDGDTLSVTSFTVAGDPATHTAGDTVTIAGVGTITIGSNGDYTFTPDANWNGTVPTITYTVSDGEGGSDTADLDIVVDPVTDLTAADDSATTDEDTPVNGSVAGNDSTTSGGDLTFEKASDPSHGTVVVNPDGTYTYTPDANYNGPDSFTYTVTDPASGETLTRTVDITVNPVNDAPTTVGTMVDQADIDAGTVAAIDVTSFFDDIDSPTLTYSASGLPAGLTIDPVTGVISGTVDNSASQGGTGGVYSVTVTATDGDGASVDQTFNWTVTNPEPVATDDSATTNEDTPVSGNVLTNDSDPDGDTLSVTSFTVAGDPATHTAGDTVTIAGVGTITIGSNGDYTFTPDANWNGTVPTITYTVSDGEGGSDTADLDITVDPVNDAPITVGTIGDQADADADTITSLDVTSFFDDIDSPTL
ncbi:Ig-like domain-containing protein, partial [Tsuneonella suprasediminis]|uniref:Ig-like domain-containing protein n=1 Tax=Tsuneonella suprasediminis TaxID=2306996 RepID=UPI002F92229E